MANNIGTPTERFWLSFDKRSNEECWIWMRCHDRDGYGYFHIKKKYILAHRFSWEMHFGEIPKNKPCVLHKCDNPSCVNPEHLFLGTQQDNVKDKINKNRQLKGEAHGCHKLTYEQVRQIRKLKGILFQKVIAEKFDVSESLISFILNNKLWKDK